MPFMKRGRYEGGEAGAKLEGVGKNQRAIGNESWGGGEKQRE